METMQWRCEPSVYICRIVYSVATGCNLAMTVTENFDHKFRNYKLILRNAVTVCGASEGEDKSGCCLSTKCVPIPITQFY
jgi:hypothetical protein